MTFDEVVARALKIEKKMSVFYFLDQLKVYFVEVGVVWAMSRENLSLGFATR